MSGSGSRVIAYSTEPRDFGGRRTSQQTSWGDKVGNLLPASSRELWKESRGVIELLKGRGGEASTGNVRNLFDFEESP